MPSPYKEIPITFEKGLVQEIEESLLDIGQASELENWEPSANGALRSRNRYSSITTDGLTAPYNVRGFGAVATGTAVAGAVSGPQIVQQSNWPNGDADPVASKTTTLTGVNIGNVLIAVVSVDGAFSATVTPGWTERAISTGDKQHVRFFTKTASSSTEPFTYTISQSQIRAVSVFEMKYLDAEDPGTKWAASTDTSIGTGTDSMTVNAVDTDGGFGIVGYHYDGGGPDSSDSGTSGWTTPTQRNQNTRTGVTFEDLDQLDGFNEDSNGSVSTYVTPSWTPPATGIIIGIVATWSPAPTTVSATGNGFTWHGCSDGGELGFSGGGQPTYGYVWADAGSAVGTTGSITITLSRGASNPALMMCSFVRAIGGDTTDPFVQLIGLTDGTVGTEVKTLTFGSGLQDGSGVIGAGGNINDGLDTAPAPTIGAGDWQAQYDSMNVTDSGIGWWGSSGTGVSTAQLRTAYINSSFPPDTTHRWTTVVNGFATYAVGYEIRGTGNAAKVYSGITTGAGTVIEEFTYVANKEITGKMVVWGYEPPTSVPDAVDFYIVMAVATDATTYRVYRIPRDEIASGTWELIDTVTDASDSNAFVSFAQGAGNLIWTASTLNYPRAIELATLSNSNIIDMLGLAGRTAAYHKDRMFIAGSSQNPSRVYFSDIGLPTDFTTVTDFLDIGGDDGEAIQDLSSVEGLLLIPKTNRAYLVSGSGIESFFVNELSGGTAAVGRSAIRTPYGTILAGTDDIWVVQGGGVDPMSRPLGAGYVITGTTSSAYAQDSVLVCDSGSEQVWRVNLVTGAWARETVTGDDAGVYIVFSLNGRIYYGVNGSSDTVGGTRKLSDPRTYDENTGGTNFIGATGRVSLLGPSAKYTPRWLFIQARNHDIDFPNTLFIDIESDHGLTTKTMTVEEATQRERIDIPKEHTGCEWIKLTFRADSSAIAGAIDPERIVLGVDTEVPR